MEQENINSFIKRALERRFCEIREKLQTCLNYVQPESYQEYNRGNFHCDKCNKEIEGEFVLVNKFKDMNQWFNDPIGEELKIYCKGCYQDEINN